MATSPIGQEEIPRTHQVQIDMPQYQNRKKTLDGQSRPQGPTMFIFIILKKNTTLKVLISSSKIFKSSL